MRRKDLMSHAPLVCLRRQTFVTAIRRGSAALGIVLLACGRSGSDAGADPPRTAGVAEAPADSTAKTSADQDFLKWMLNHHAEMVYVAHQLVERPDAAQIRADARSLDVSHDAESASMRRLLQDEFQDAFEPKVRVEHQAMVAPFATMTARNLPDGFRSFLGAHHREAIRYIDSVRPALSNTRVRTLADSIRAARNRDVAELSVSK